MTIATMDHADVDFGLLSAWHGPPSETAARSPTSTRSRWISPNP